MGCDLCMRSPGASLSFYCPSCARSILYDLRMRKAKILVENEELTSQIERVTSAKEPLNISSRDQTSEQDEAHINLNWSIQSKNVKRAQAKEKVQEYQKHNQGLGDEIRISWEDIARRKTALHKKQEEWMTTKAVLSGRQDDTSDRLRGDIKKVTKSWDAVHNKAIETRRFLCREAAHLCGLKQRKKVKSGMIRDQYWIGGVAVIALKEVNGAKLNELTTSLTNIARLVVLVSFYLSVRLPAEIVLPQRNYPLPMIFTPANSYQGRGLHFPGTTPTASSFSSPVASRQADVRSLPRPRPLFIEAENFNDKMPHLAKSDPTAFSFFLEGISLLAWDIAWLCRSQGMYTGTESWEDVCNMGRNLWNLLIAPPQPAALLRVMAGKDGRHTFKPTNTGSGNGNETPDTNLTTPLGADKSLRLGHFSHDSAHSFADHGADLVRGWKLNKYTTIVDPLKKALLSEMSNAEWEMLEQEEWDDGGEQFGHQEAVLIKNRTRKPIDAEGGNQRLAAAAAAADDDDEDEDEDDMRSIMTARADQASPRPRERKVVEAKHKIEGANYKDGDKNSADGSRLTTTPTGGTSGVKRTSGWTKLKNRGDKVTGTTTGR